MTVRHLICTLALAAASILGATASPSLGLKEQVRQGEQLLEQGEYSRAKWLLQNAYSEIDPDDYDNDPEFYERLMNDCTECQIHLDECARAYVAFYYKARFSSLREQLRHLHLECLLMQRPIMIKALGAEKAQKRNLECAEEAFALLQKSRQQLSAADVRSLELDILNDRLEIYHDLRDQVKIDELMTEYRRLATSVSDEDSRWPWIYFELEADRLYQDGKAEQALELYRKVLDYCWDYNLEKAYIPCASMADIYITAGQPQKVHDVVLGTARCIRRRSLETFRKMTSEERYTAWGNATTVKAYKVLPQMPEGTYEDILYGAALYSKNVLMDIDLEEAAFVWRRFDMDFLRTYRLRTLFAGTDNSLYSEWNFKEETQKRNPLWSPMNNGWTDVQAQLSDHEAAVEIIRTGGSFQDYTAVVVRKGWPRPVAVPLCTEQDLQDLGLDADLYRGDKSRRCYDLLVKPLEKYLDRGDDLFFSPEGTVNAINVAALCSDDGSLASERYRIHRVTTTSRLSKNNTPARYDDIYLFGAMDYYCSMDSIREYSELMRSSDPLLWFDERKTYPLTDLSFGEEEDGTRAGLRPLEYTGKEVDGIESMAAKGMEIHKFTGWRANEECFKKSCSPIMLNATSIYHIATHSFSMPGDQDMLSRLSDEEVAFKRSGLMFSGAGHTAAGEKMPEGVNDGMLYAEEIAALDMRNADMVVLSACNTALGEYTLNGVMGLQRAFKKAGCKTIVMTLWKVNDKATSLFMTTFYSNLFEGDSKHSAFMKAQGAVRTQYDDPYYWAPFIMLD